MVEIVGGENGVVKGGEKRANPYTNKVESWKIVKIEKFLNKFKRLKNYINK